MEKIIWFGYGGHSHIVEKLRPIIEELGMKLFTIHEHENADIKWSLHTWKDELRKADIIILPCDFNKFPAKSANKLIQSLAFGKPTICSPLPAYIEVEKKHPGCCLVATSEEEWKSHLIRIKDDEDFRNNLSQKGLIASKDYSIDVMGDKWVKTLLNVTNEKVDIVIPTYNNLPCLKLCLDSIRYCTTIAYNLIVVNNGPNEDMHQFLESQKDVKYIRKGRLNFAQAVNVGIKAGNSKYVMILNDDVIVSKGWLEKLVETANQPEMGAVGPLSNCDKGWLHKYNINVGGVELLPGMNTLDQITPVIPLIYEYKSSYNETPSRDWVAFYCTLIHREVINRTGYLDEGFTNSGEDVDYCRRIRKMGYKIVQDFRSFCFHFGAVSRKLLEQEDRGSYQKADYQTQTYLREKYSKETVVLYSGPSWERWDFRNVDGPGIGGSETWQVCLAREFDKLGYRVISFCDCPESGIRDGGVEYRHYTMYNKFIEENWIDYFISSRTTEPFKFPLRAGKIYTQIHDVWYLSDRNQTFLDRIDKHCCLSEWHKDFVSGYHGIPQEKIEIMANGVDFSRFDGHDVARDPYRLIWSSSWDRGLDNLLYMLPFIREKIPLVNLHIFYGVQTWKQSCLRNNDQQGLKKIQWYEDEIKKQPNITVHGRISQKELAIEFLKSSLWLYPTAFTETWCISAVEAQRARVPVICHNFAGLKTTLGDSAIMLGDGGNALWPYSKEGREAFITEAVDILTDKNKWNFWSEKGFKNTEKYSWKKTAERWDNLFKSIKS